MKADISKFHLLVNKKDEVTKKIGEEIRKLKTISEKNY